MDWTAALALSMPIALATTVVGLFATRVWRGQRTRELASADLERIAANTQAAELAAAERVAEDARAYREIVAADNRAAKALAAHQAISGEERRERLADTAAARNLAKFRDEREQHKALKIAKLYARADVEAAEIAAEATVRAARYRARAIVPKPKTEPLQSPRAFDRWMATNGRSLPDSVRDQVEWACSRLRGEESDDQGDAEDARGILANFAPGLAQAVEDERRAEIAKS